MKYLDFTFPTPEENLACDEALLDTCESSPNGTEILRFWEPKEHFVVLGYSNKAREEIDMDACRRVRIPVLRRSSGGGTILQGPGCLNYTLILKISRAKELANLSKTNCFILKRHATALEPMIGKKIEIAGISDLAIQTVILRPKAEESQNTDPSPSAQDDIKELKKFSGNAQRRKKHYLLFHGTFLIDFDLARIEQFLPIPRKQPAYRKNRAHAEFLTNIGTAPPAKVKEALRIHWAAKETLKEIPVEKIRELVRAKYASRNWNLKF